MKDFNNLNFSVFECDFNSFTKAMYEQYKQSFVENRVKIYSSPLDVTEYIDVPHGGSHYPKMSWWANKLYRNLIFFISNRRDGMSSLCHNISRELGCKLYKFGISKGEEAYYGCTFFAVIKGKMNDQFLPIWKTVGCSGKKESCSHLKIRHIIQTDS